MPYDISIKTVALAGATGTVGDAILHELLSSGLFDITVLTRQAAAYTFPHNVKVVEVDYNSLESLSASLKGQDALVSTLNPSAVQKQKLLIDAAVKSGVKRIIPSEFGCDLYDQKLRALPVHNAKVEIQKYLAALAETGPTSYTLVFTGPFIDLGLKNGMFFNFKERKAELYDGGEELISMTRLPTAGKAVRRILTHPRETADRAVRVKDIDLTQRQLLDAAQALTPGEEWDVRNVDTTALGEATLQQMEGNEPTSHTMLELLRRSIFGKGYNGHFERVHNQVLGIRGMTEPELKGLCASIL